MPSVLSFDELNVLDPDSRKSEEYDEYFSGMGLTEKQKQNRVKLSHEFEKEFFPVLVYLVSLRPFMLLDEPTAREWFLTAYITAYQTMLKPDDYMDEYADKFATEVARSTVDHIDDPYFFSLDRAKYLSENEANTAWNHDDHEKALLAGKKYKRWIDMKDNRVRPTHRAVGSTVKLIQEPFVVGSSLMQYPKDDSLGADAEEIVNCRCTIKYF